MKSKTNNFGNFIKQRRLDLKMTGQMLADKIGVSRVSISHYETGRKKPTIRNLGRLAKVLGMKYEDLRAILREDIENGHTKTGRN